MSDQYYSEVYERELGTDLIIDRINQLMIEGIPDDEQFLLDRHEVQYYGSDFGDPLVFQTIGYINQPELYIQQAIMWYATELLDYPDMELSKYPV